MTEIESLMGRINYSDIPLIAKKHSYALPGLLSLGMPEVPTRGAMRRPGTRGFGETLSIPDRAVEEDEISDLLSRARRRSSESYAERKPETVIQLERILSMAYEASVEITSINEIPQTRKEVKEVHFMKNNDAWLHKVWIFKANPKETGRELTVYYIAYEHGVPTGKPIAFKPGTEQYNFDIAILGGFVEHAGNNYNVLVNNLRFTPVKIHNVAEGVAAIIAESHVKLTAAINEFAQYGVTLEKSSPAREIEERFAAGLGIDKSKAKGLIRAVEQLYKAQSGIYVVSHCDLHTGNVVTKEKSFAMSTNEFGIIDWGSVGLDSPYADIRDFWLHHRRQAIKATKAAKEYGFDYETVEQAYATRCNILAPKDNELFVDFKAAKKDSLIQSALWNLYEMYDPVRTDNVDIEAKAAEHCTMLMKDLSDLTNAGYRKEADGIKKELMVLLSDRKYLADIWQKN